MSFEKLCKSFVLLVSIIFVPQISGEEVKMNVTCIKLQNSPKIVKCVGTEVDLQVDKEVIGMNKVRKNYEPFSWKAMKNIVKLESKCSHDVFITNLPTFQQDLLSNLKVFSVESCSLKSI